MTLDREQRAEKEKKGFVSKKTVSKDSFNNILSSYKVITHLPNEDLNIQNVQAKRALIYGQVRDIS